MQPSKFTDLTAPLYPAESAHQQATEGYFGDATLRELTALEKDRLCEINLCLVAFSNRSGSTLLTELMHQCGFPVPPRSEVFNSDEIIMVSRGQEIPSFTDYFFRLVDGWEKEGHVGYKISARQLFWLTRTGLLSHMKRVRIVNPVRRDRLAQAVSLYIARTTGAWHTRMAAEEEKASVPYSREGILQALHTVCEIQHLIDYYIQLHDVPSVAVAYESLCADPEAEVARVADFLDYPSIHLDVLDMGSVGIRQQRGALNTALVDQFRADFHIT